LPLEEDAIMNLRELRVGWRALIKEPSYSLVVVLGLAVGFAACLLLIGFVRYSWQYDAQVPDVDNVYIAKLRYNIDSASPWFEQAPSLLREVAQTTPSVTDATGMVRWGDIPVRVGNQLFQLQGNPVFPHFASMLGVKVLEGNIDIALTQPDSIVITGDAAQRLFGTTHALNRTVQIDGKTIRIAAVVIDPPTNTIMPYQVLFGTQSVLIDDRMRTALSNGSNWIKLLIRVRPGSSLTAITDLMQQAVDASPVTQEQINPEIRQRLGTRKVMDIAFSPLREAYFDRDIAANPIDKPGDRGDKTVITGLAAIALLILVLAAINYVNLATVRVLQRQREIGIRKTLGAGTWQIVRQFCVESLLVTMIAVTAGLALAWIALPLFSELMNRKLDSVFSIANIAFAFTLAVALGMICAIYPAWIAIKVKPAQTLAGRQNTESMHGMRLRRALNVIQLAGAMGLAGVALAVAWQTEFALRADPGFDPSPLLIVDIPESAKDSEKARGFITALSRQAGVTGIAVSTDAVGRFDNVWGIELKREGGSSVFLEMKSVSANFFEQYRINAAAGRLYDSHIDKEDDAKSLIINAEAARQLGFATPQAALGQVVLLNTTDGKTQSQRIIGIAPEVRFHSLHEAPRAIGYELWGAGTTLSVRAAGSVPKVEQAIWQLWPSYFPDKMARIYHADDILSASYDNDSRLARLLVLSTIVILAIAAFGAYALSARTVQRRAREIVLRKLHGASTGDIGLLVVREIGKLIFVAAIISSPLAAITIDHYLSGYVEHAPIGYWTLLFALAVTCVTALLAAARHTWIAAQMPPAKALKI
jgi:putative ABC transport system permease protein